MTQRRSIWEWSKAYVGDPDSWQARGEMITEFLRENGMTPQSQVLDIGCGNLSEGAPLIRYLQPAHFVGIDPSGWLIESALQEMPELESQAPVFLHRSDFDASEIDRRFDFVVAHSVLSHCAHWQLDALLANTRKVVEEGAVFLCSFRNDQFNTWAPEWVYPGISTFRLPTIMAAGTFFGWHVEIVPEYRERLMEVAPNDGHDWLRMTACESSADRNNRRRAQEEAENDLRIAEEEEQERERLVLSINENSRVADLEEADDERIREMGWIP